MIMKKAKIRPLKPSELEKGVPDILGTPESVGMAEGPGFEPGLTGPEPVVLPLDDPSAFCNYN
jgi:hypothetical protein